MNDYWNNTGFIDYPDKVSEREVQAELFVKLKCLGYNARCDVRGENSGRKTKFDIVIFDINNNAKFIIEIKSNNYDKSYVINKFNTSKRKQKYDRFNIPTLCCANKKSISSLIWRLKKEFEPDYKPEPFFGTPKIEITDEN